LDLLNACKSQLSGVQTMGPVPAPLARVANRSRFQLMLLGESRRALHGAIDRLHLPQRTAQVRWSIDIDPYDSL
jgi:primosomal protein N' (replication factor Y)